MRWCLWCAEELKYVPGKGWLHPDGELVVTYIGADGKVRDDHCAFPTDDRAAAQQMALERKEERARREEKQPGLQRRRAT